jgi:hypothetical protein
LEDLSAINYRLQGLVEKKPETQETILVKRRKHRAISIKGRGWALCVKVGSLEGVICRLVETHKTYLIITGKRRGLCAKPPCLLLPLNRTRTGARRSWPAAALMVGRLQARVTRGMRRVDRGELNVVLTKVEDER